MLVCRSGSHIGAGACGGSVDGGVPYLHVSAANTHPWYPAAGIRSNKIRTAGADERTGQQRVSPLHPKAGGTSLDEIHDPPLSQ